MTRGIGQVNAIPILGLTPVALASDPLSAAQTAWNSAVSSNRTFTNSDFTAETSSSGDYNFVGLGSIASGFYYVEFEATSTWSSSGGDAFVGFGTSASPLASAPGISANSFGWRMVSSSVSVADLGGTVNNAVLPTVSGISSGDYIQFFVDMENAKLFCGYNDDFGTQDPVAGTNPVLTGFSTASPLYRHARVFYAGDELTITNPIELRKPFLAWGLE